MAVGRRSFMALLGLGSAAAPVALPAFGKAVIQKELLAKGAGSAGRYYGGIDAPDLVNYADESAAKYIKRQAINEFLGHLIKDQEEAELRRNRFHDIAAENYILPSWSTTFRNHMIRKEYDARCEAAKTIRETIQEKLKGFVGFSGYDSDQCEVATTRPY